MHGHQHRPLDVPLAPYDSYYTKSNGPAERIATYQGIYGIIIKIQVETSQSNLCVRKCVCVFFSTARLTSSQLRYSLLQPKKFGGNCT